MPIYQHLKDRSFRPDEIALLVSAFEGALQDLGLTDRGDPVVGMVARRIMAAALKGERDPVRLREAGIKGTR
jgi:hypothetical protein